MSEENVEVAHAGLDAWNRGDIDALLALCHQDVESVTSGTFPGLDPVYRGHEGLRRFWRDFRGTWESLVLAPDEVRDCGDQVVVLFWYEARGRDGLEVRRPGANVVTFRDGRVERIETFAEWAGALQAVGLSE